MTVIQWVGVLLLYIVTIKLALMIRRYDLKTRIILSSLVVLTIFFVTLVILLVFGHIKVIYGG